MAMSVYRRVTQPFIELIVPFHGSVELACMAKSPIRDLQELACVPPGKSFCQAPWGNFEFYLDMRVLATYQIKLKRKLLQNKTLVKLSSSFLFEFYF